MCSLKITIPLCLLPTRASLLKSLSPKRESQSVAWDQTKKKERREGLKWKMECKREGRHTGRAGEILWKMWDRRVFERVKVSSWSCRLLAVVNCSLSSGQPASVLYHYTPIWPEGSCKSWCCNKSTQCSEMWNNRRAFTGPGGSVRVVHHTSSESDTPQSHLCFPDSVSDSQPATVPVQPATQWDVSSSSLLLLRCAFFPPLSAWKINGTDWFGCWFVFSQD